MNSKLIKELPELIKNQVISEEIALNIRQYYQSKTANEPNKLFAFFAFSYGQVKETSQRNDIDKSNIEFFH